MKDAIDWYYGAVHEPPENIKAKRMKQKDDLCKKLSGPGGKRDYMYMRKLRFVSKSYELFKERGIFNVAVRDIIEPFGLKLYHFHTLYKNKEHMLKVLQQVYGDGEVKIEDTF